MTKSFHISEGVKVKVQEHIGKYITDTRKVCPDCAEHEQLSMREVNKMIDKIGETDCKNTFWDIIDGERITVGQCCCYSKVHGMSGGFE